MPSSQYSREVFLAKHPACAFCGAPSTTVEHCPPRALFQFRVWPEGFEFPACDACNHGTADYDIVVAMLARMDPTGDSGNQDGKQVGYMKNVNARFPALFKRMMPTAVEARRFNRVMGIRPEPGQTHQEICPVKVPDEVHDAVCVFARKLSKGVYYQTTGQVFPEQGGLALNWFTNADLMSEGKYPVFELLREVSGVVPQLKRAGADLSEQFQYKISLADDGTVMVLQAIFGKAFGFVVFGTTVRGVIEGIIERLRAATGRTGPFALL